MTNEERKILENFENRLHALLYNYDALKRENKELKATLANYQHIEDQYRQLKIAKAISLKDSDIKESKRKLAKLVREIDECIALLNE